MKGLLRCRGDETAKNARITKNGTPCNEEKDISKFLYVFVFFAVVKKTLCLLRSSCVLYYLCSSVRVFGSFFSLSLVSFVVISLHEKFPNALCALCFLCLVFNGSGTVGVAAGTRLFEAGDLLDDPQC